MLTIERVRREVRDLPLLVRGGVATLAFSGIADVIAHLEAGDHTGHLHTHTSAELSAHLLGFVSMVVILLGVAIDGARRNRNRRGSAGNTKGVA
jgi:hypothetical protein